MNDWGVPEENEGWATQAEEKPSSATGMRGAAKA